MKLTDIQIGAWYAVNRSTLMAACRMVHFSKEWTASAAQEALDHARQMTGDVSFQASDPELSKTIHDAHSALDSAAIALFRVLRPHEVLYQGIAGPKENEFIPVKALETGQPYKQRLDGIRVEAVRRESREPVSLIVHYSALIARWGDHQRIRYQRQMEWRARVDAADLAQGMDAELERLLGPAEGDDPR